MACGIPDPERDAQIIKLNQQGLSHDTVAERLGITRGAVRHVLKKHGISSKGGPRPQWDDDRVQVAAKLWAEGLSAGEIGKELGVSRNSVMGVLTRRGLMERPEALNIQNRLRGSAATRSEPIAPKKGSVKKTGPRPGKVAASIHPKLVAPIEIVDAVTLLHLHAGMCKWPIELPGTREQHFCGRTASKPYKAGADATYCVAHGRKAYQPASRKAANRHVLKPGAVPVDFRRCA